MAMGECYEETVVITESLKIIMQLLFKTNYLPKYPFLHRFLHPTWISDQNCSESVLTLYSTLYCEGLCTINTLCVHIQNKATNINF